MFQFCLVWTAFRRTMTTEQMWWWYHIIPHDTIEQAVLSACRDRLYKKDCRYVGPIFLIQAKIPTLVDCLNAMVIFLSSRQFQWYWVAGGRVPGKISCYRYFSAKKGGQAGACNDVIVLHKCKSFCFSWTDLISGFQSCFRISILFHDLGMGSHVGSQDFRISIFFHDFNLFFMI